MTRRITVIKLNVKSQWNTKPKMPVVILTKMSVTMKRTTCFGMKPNVTLNITATAIPTVCTELFAQIAHKI